MTTYKISASWNARGSRLHGATFGTLEEALDALGSHITDDGWSDVDDDERGCTAFGVYSSEEDRAANDEGAAPHRCLAVIRAIENGERR